MQARGPIADSMIEWARATAVRVHAGQTYGDQSYFSGHLEVVANLVRDAWAPRSPPALVLSAAYLHDALEDTELTYAEISLISPRLAQLVQILTKPEGSRREVLPAYYARVRRSPYARHVKVADRLANVLAASGKHAEMYLGERDEFAKLSSIHDNGPTCRLWARLHDAYERLGA